MKSSVVQQALIWLSWLFRVPIEALDYSRNIGSDLKPSPESFYGKETFDVVVEDVNDIEKILKEEVLNKESGFTVGDFCGLVERLQHVDPTGCQRLLRSWKRIIMIDQKPEWRKFLFKVVGY